MKILNKKLISLLLSLILVIGAMPFAALHAFAANASDLEGLLKTVNNGGNVKMTNDISLTEILIIPSGNTVTLDLNGKTLDRGLQGAQSRDNGGVIRVEPGATLTVKDSSGTNSGTITGGASFNGGGICNHGTLYFEGGTISGNRSSHSHYGNGGGIFNSEYNGSKATLYLKGGVITNNEAKNGGGVYNGTNGTVIIEQAVVTKKVGILSKTTYTNIKITGNKATKDGGGIFNGNELTVSGAPEIYENDQYDLYLASGKKISFAGELGSTQKIRIKAAGNNPVITGDYSTYNTKRPSEVFASVDTSYVPVFSASENGEIMLKNDSKTVVQIYENKKLVKIEEFDSPADAWDKALSYAGENTYTSGVSNEESVAEITLGSNWDAGKCLYTGKKKNIVVDLNGFYIRRDGKKTTNGSVFNVGDYAMLTITDSNPGSSGYSGHNGGVIADGNAKDSGSGIVLQNYAKFYMEGGTVYNCKTDLHGGGVYTAGEHTTVNLQNCTIDACLTKDSGDDCHGGGICIKNADSVFIKDVTVKNCHAEDKGGALYLREKPRNVKLVNVTFEKNYADDGGGAIFIDDISDDTAFRFEAEKCTFTNNKANDNGGAVNVRDDDEYGNRNATIFRDCTFTGNESTKYGGAIEVNDNGVVLSGGTITNNKASGKGGGVYVEGEYDISVSGKLIIKDNDGQGNYDNLCLEEKSGDKACCYCAGLYKGSEVHISTSNNKTGFALVKNVNEKQADYFKIDKGSLEFKKTGTGSAALVTASLFGGGTGKVIAIFAVGFIALAAAAIIIKKKKGGGNVDNTDEDE